MNYFNLDLMRQLAMELGLRNGGPINDEVIGWNLLKELQMKRNSDVKRRYHGKEQSDFKSEDCRAHPPHMCRSCACCPQQLRCSACTHPVSENRVPPCKYCHYVPEPCGAFHDYHTQGNQCYHHCQKPKQPCWPANHIMCQYLPLDINKKEHPKCCKGSKRPKVERKLVLFNDDNVDVNTKEVLDENSHDSEKRPKTKEAHRRQSTATLKPRDVVKSNNSESDGDYYIPHAVGSGDKSIARSETSTSIKPVRRPESYFLPMSALRE
uniref:Uncharacterized protein n=2 Tax=Cuerna arida TaxID=1464854 RepID=A0A1B6F6N1_9HEMI